MAESSVAVEYRGIPGFSRYQVGNDGTIWSRNGFGPKKFRVNGRDKWIQIFGRSENGYQVVQIVGDDGIRRVKLAHRLVLEAFVGPCPEGMEACHFPDATRSNNRIENLRWDTKAANTQDCISLGNTLKGENNPNACLSNEMAKQIRIEFAESFPTIISLSEKYGISEQAISRIVVGKTYKQAGGPISVVPKRKTRKRRKVIQ